MIGPELNYACRVICRQLEELGAKEFHPAQRYCLGRYVSGVHLRLAPAAFLTIQTHSDIVGPAFAETAVRTPKGLLELPELGYVSPAQTLRHMEPEDLFEHLRRVLEWKADQRE